MDDKGIPMRFQIKKRNMVLETESILIIVIK
jgi:hypothetical protein